MSTSKQKLAARQNLRKAIQARSSQHRSTRSPRRTEAMSTADRDRIPNSQFAFPEDRKEPLTDASHVRNAVARFDQVEGVTDAERDRAWRRIRSAARKFDVDIEARGWRDLVKGGKATKG